VNPRRILLSAAVGIALATAGVVAICLRPDQPTAPVDITVYERVPIEVGGEVRAFRLTVPRSLPVEGVPLVIAFHGLGESASSMAEYARLDQLAVRHHVLVAMPEMSHGTWAVRGPDALSTENPDVGLFDALLNRLEQRYPLDAHRVYVLGMSNGASFVQLLMRLRSSRIAAVVAHSGPPPREVDGKIPERHCPVLLLVGADDSRFIVDDMTEAARAYRASGHSVDLIEVDGLGHAWSVDHDVAIWDFLARNRLPE
jgi:poly(3-hydroxybutyrate) depolymerase